MRDLGERRAIKEIAKSLSQFGYQVETKILKAEEYGVPQERRHLFRRNWSVAAPTMLAISDEWRGTCSFRHH